MSNILKVNRYLIGRRIVQIGILFLFWGANHWGWKFLAGNLSTAHLFDEVYLSDPYAVLQMLFSGLVVSIDVLIGALIIFVFYALIAGRSYCSWVCPVNFVTDMANWIRRKWDMRSMKILNIKRKTRFWILGLSLILSLILGVAAFEFISPISMMHRGIIYGIGAGWLAVLMVFLFDLIVLKHGWCGYLCPLGAFYTAISVKSLIRVNHTKENCTDCLDCKVVCPELQVLENIGEKSGIIDFGACTNCGRCIEVCQDNALNFSFRTMTAA